MALLQYQQPDDLCNLCKDRLRSILVLILDHEFGSGTETSGEQRESRLYLCSFTAAEVSMLYFKVCMMWA